MSGRMVRIAGLFLLSGMLTACAAGDEPRLLNLRAPGPGPDEFAVVPAKPLQAPRDYAALPPPLPGAANLADPTPDADAAAALGGSRAAVTGGGVRDPGLVAYAGRFGVAPGIRSQLAAEDLQFRRENDGLLLERVFNVNTYFKAYRPQSLDQYAELERFRRAGLRTPAAPPEGLER
ncbi:hypothetical protein OCGS_2497 [Oceaniovalibus guishaninsula JLT2003]|uniref:Pyruvate/2-oxoglutarate dehydrogenase complex, dihydrolipoamide acyltransferase (E2) component n=1 Tax=Oceaniovalibus guishaninsula JLT2003 TaxID=1231392 RepID=K2HKI8_9RHOB|nr:DUF3035 domain-containing protein [Oceaniovalibus guishaninsula]EKE43459.1 hypothetical protein OCGS_2497 [Oceaniovalibus guishaninsula JLT2003]